jgi:NIMA (never in mitosis gene a)-related kinase
MVGGLPELIRRTPHLTAAVFLGEDNSVKLGDFGLSKVMQSHDFASTYVGTPFYMSPEICAAEKYTLKSDIWSLGCIIYELCTREPPFNAKTHFQLVQKIKEGKIAPLPAIYSSELFAIIKDCLRVNPDRRPDTAMLLNLPVVRLMRKEKEVVEFSKILKSKEESLNRRIREFDQKLTTFDHDKASMRQEIDSSLRREWEVKARLEIDRLVAQEMELLQKKFEHEVQMRVEMELQHRKEQERPQDLSSSVSKSDYPHSSIGSNEGEFSSATDISELSVESPDASMHALKKSHRTPFARAQTMFAMAPAGTPMDIEMASPSPITIASLSLSPRRNIGTKAPVLNPGNIFTANQMAGEARWEAAQDSDSEFEDDIHVPSPTRMIKSSKNPFTSKGRPQLHAQKSMPTHRLQSKQSQQLLQGKTIPVAASTPDLQTAVRTTGSAGALQDRSNSPHRRLTKIPSAASLKTGNSDGSANPLNRKPSMGKKDLEQQQQQPQPPALSKLPAATTAASKNNNIRGRTLVELQQARAGGRPMSAVFTGELQHGLLVHHHNSAGNVSPVRAFREHAAAANRGATAFSEPAAVWDPERDEMPSPFLVRRKPVVMKGERGTA